MLPGDVRDPFFVQRAATGADTVFHLAALIPIPYSYLAPLEFVQTNVEGTLNVLEAARRHGTRRVLHTSTSETYGTARYTPIDEKHPLQGQSPYSASKIGADKLAESYARSFGTPVVTVRPFNTYGPRQSARAFLPTVLSQALTGDRVRVGSLEPVRDMNFVADTVAGFVAAATAPGVEGLTINLGSGRGVSMRELLDLAIRAVGARGARRAGGGARAARGQRGDAAASATPPWRASGSAGRPGSRSRTACAAPRSGSRGTSPITSPGSTTCSRRPMDRRRELPCRR